MSKLNKIMERKIFLVLAISTIIFGISSCTVSKQYVQYVSKKEDIKTPETKNVLIFATEDVRVNEFVKTFNKNFTTKRDFTLGFMNEFSDKLKANRLFHQVSMDTESTNYDSLNLGYADYVIYLSNFEITNRVEWQNSGGFGVNGMSTNTSIEYCIINVKVEVYDAKTGLEILDFVAIGEDAVFLFNFTKTFNEAKDRAMNHIINYLKSGQTEYVKY